MRQYRIGQKQVISDKENPVSLLSYATLEWQSPLTSTQPKTVQTRAEEGHHQHRIGASRSVTTEVTPFTYEEPLIRPAGLTTKLVPDRGKEDPVEHNNHRVLLSD